MSQSLQLSDEFQLISIDTKEDDYPDAVQDQSKGIIVIEGLDELDSDASPRGCSTSAPEAVPQHPKADYGLKLSASIRSIRETEKSESDQEEKSDKQQIECGDKDWSGSSEVIVAIPIDDYYLMTSKKQIKDCCNSQQQWAELFSCYRQEGAFFFNIKHFNSILALDKSQKLWEGIISLNIAHPKSIILQAKQIKLMKSRLHKLKQLLEGVQKYTQKSSNLAQQKTQGNSNTSHNNYVESTQSLLAYTFQVIEQVLIEYAQSDPQIRYSKGMEYVAFGIAISENGGKPLKKESKQTDCKRILKYFCFLMKVRQLRTIYLEDNLRYFNELQSMSKQLESQCAWFTNLLNSNKIQFSKLFLCYYKSCMLYNLTDRQLMAKIMQFILLYGVEFIRIVIIRCISSMKHKIMKLSSQQLGFYLQRRLLPEYFQQFNSVSKAFNNLISC